VFPEGDVAELAETLARLQVDPALRARLAARGAASVERLFSAPAAAAALESLLLEAIA